MEFHEDIIFKNNGEIYGQDLIEIVKIKGKLIKLHQTESSIIQPKMYKPDLIMELEDRIIIFEFQSTRVNTKDKRRFRFYSALFDHIKIKSKKPIEVHVLSTVEKEQTKWYNVNSEACFPIYIHSLKNIDGDKLLNRMNAKIGTNQKLTTKDLLIPKANAVVWKLISMVRMVGGAQRSIHTVLHSVAETSNIIQPIHS